MFFKLSDLLRFCYMFSMQYRILFGFKQLILFSLFIKLLSLYRFNDLYFMCFRLYDFF